MVGASGSELSLVWQPLQIGPLEVRNRIMMTALTTLYGRDHVLSDRHIAYYRERARGGVALMVTEQQGAHPYADGSFQAGCSAWDRRSIPQYAKLADAVHEDDAKMFVQLYAPGVHDKGMTGIDNWHPVWGASPIPSFIHEEVPMVMDQAHMQDMAHRYGESAGNVLTSGLDGVEIHAAHSYLLGQFLSPAYNQRDDAYGGSVANRCRLVLEVTQEVRRIVGDKIVVGLRLSFDDFMGDVGITGEQTEEQLEIFASSGLFDYFSIAGGGYHTLHLSSGSMAVEHGFMVPFGKRAKAVVGDRAPVFIVGRITELDMAERILSEGSADMVAMTRAHLADPFLVAKARGGRKDEHIHCVGANECLGRLFDQKEITCAVNPILGREERWGEGTLDVVSEGDRKSIVIIGGGPAGMRAASTAAKRGHYVTLLERESVLGGHLDILKRLPSRSEWDIAIGDLERLMRISGVKVELSTEATPSLVEEHSPGVIVCATGSHYDMSGYTPFRPGVLSVPGIDQGHVIDVTTACRRALGDPESLGTRVVIIDESGEYLPLGLAEILGQAGVSVEVISPRTAVGEDLLRTLEASHLFPRLMRLGVTLTPQTFIDEVLADSIVISDIWTGSKKEVREVTTLVLSLLRLPNDGLFKNLSGGTSTVYRLGDALAPRRLPAVIYEGEELGRSL
ncbi:MAG: FAD-dependent oxidoreductase [Actinobacteria bacterium]|nr:FAD-dependent oxidoreductase [Actinomycetota bacterium]